MKENVRGRRRSGWSPLMTFFRVPGRRPDMCRKSCPACFGIGSYFGKEWLQDDSGISIFKTATVRKPCEICGGSGRIWEPGQPHHFPLARSGSTTGNPGAGRASGKCDRVFACLIAGILTGYIGFQIYQSSSATDWWVKTACASLASAVLGIVLKNPAGPTSFIRRCTWVVVLVAVSGAFAFELLHR